jgi:hypothetical protein
MVYFLKIGANSFKNSSPFRAERGCMRKQIVGITIFLGVCVGMAGCANSSSVLESSEDGMNSSQWDSTEEYTDMSESSLENGVNESETGNPSDNDQSKSTDEEDNGLAGRAAEMFSRIWEGYPEEERFSVVGGDDDNAVENGPGAFSVQNTDALTTRLLFPSEQVGMIDDAASMMHMMNSNTFTGGIYHVTDTSNVETLAEAMKDNIKDTQWVCGYPDRLLIADLEDGYVLCAFGEEETMQTFKKRMTEAYGESKILYDEKIDE